MNNLKKLTTGAISAAAGVLASTGMVFAQNPVGNISVNIPPAFNRTVGGLFTNILSFVLVIAGILVFAYLVWGGIEWITSGGDSGKTEKARNKITGAIIGLVILVASYAIFQLVLSLLNIKINDIFNPVVTP